MWSQYGARACAIQVGFQKDSKWMYSGSEDGTVKLWDMRAPGFQREYASRGAVNTVVLHPNQGELVSGAHHWTRSCITLEQLHIKESSCAQHNGAKARRRHSVALCNTVQGCETWQQNHVTASR